jgi:hypothetical protein
MAAQFALVVADDLARNKSTESFEDGVCKGLRAV